MDGMEWMGQMVIIGHMCSKSTFSANKNTRFNVVNIQNREALFSNPIEHSNMRWATVYMGDKRKRGGDEGQS